MGSFLGIDAGRLAFGAKTATRPALRIDGPLRFNGKIGGESAGMAKLVQFEAAYSAAVAGGLATCSILIGISESLFCGRCFIREGPTQPSNIQRKM